MSERPSEISVLFLCTKNESRGPAMQYVFQRMATERGATHINFDSAALDRVSSHARGLNGYTESALTQADYLNIRHFPKSITPELLSRVQVVLTATEIHRLIASQKVPDGVFVDTLGHFATGSNIDIEDPSDRVKDVRIHLDQIPLLPPQVKRGIYGTFRYIDREDEQAIVAQHRAMVRQIREYAPLALDRLVREGVPSTLPAIRPQTRQWMPALGHFFTTQH